MATPFQAFRIPRISPRTRAFLGALWLTALFGTDLLLLITLIASTPPYRFRTPIQHPPTIIYSSDGEILARFTDKYRILIPLHHVPRHTVHAILAAEDARFFYHHGLDWRGMLRAAWVNMIHGHIRQGGSTITQQLVRLELLDDSRTVRRKWREVVLALRVERAYSKSEILERYLNSIYFGGGAYGIEAASRSYFGKSASALTPAESAMLAGLIRAPSDGNPRFHFAVARRRQRSVLDGMRAHGWLTTAQYRQALQAPLTVHPRRSREMQWKAPYAVEMVRQELLKRYGREMTYHGGLMVYTTIDSHMQAAAERAMHEAWAAGRGRRVSAGALVALAPQTGDIKALVGGPDFWRTPFNRAIQAHRQPGSAFKAFVYLAAIQHGRLLTDRMMDAPIRIGRWSPKNYGGRYHGHVDLQTALALSLNSVAVRLTLQLGPHAVITAAHAAGISSPMEPDLSLALGSYEVTPLEMARAFSTFANGGKRVDTRLIKEVRRGTTTLFITVPAGHSSIKSCDAFLLTQGLMHVITEGTGKRASTGRPAAGKTGTSNRHRDAWFVGYTPQLCTAVWMGNDNRAPMAGVAGGSLPAPAWAHFMSNALAGKPHTAFPVPNDVTLVPIDPRTGMLAAPDCPNPVFTYVPTGRIPMTPAPDPEPRVPKRIPHTVRDPFAQPPDEMPDEEDPGSPPWPTPRSEPMNDGTPHTVHPTSPSDGQPQINTPSEKDPRLIAPPEPVKDIPAAPTVPPDATSPDIPEELPPTAQAPEPAMPPPYPTIPPGEVEKPVAPYAKPLPDPPPLQQERLWPFR